MLDYPADITAIIEKQKSGLKIDNDEILTLMNYALELLEEFGRLTQESIDRKKASIA